MALQILGQKFYKNTKKSSLYSQSLLFFIRKTPVVKNHPTTGEIRELLRLGSTPTGITTYLYMSSSLIYILEIHRESFKYSVDEDIIENNYMFVMLWNLSDISHLIFPQRFFSFLAKNLQKKNEMLRSLLRENYQKLFFLNLMIHINFSDIYIPGSKEKCALCFRRFSIAHYA